MKPIVSDTILRDTVIKALDDDPEVAAKHITVTAIDGAITRAGHVITHSTSSCDRRDPVPSRPVPSRIDRDDSDDRRLRNMLGGRWLVAVWVRAAPTRFGRTFARHGSSVVSVCSCFRGRLCGTSPTTGSGRATRFSRASSRA
jgi:hypothetical protein